TINGTTTINGPANINGDAQISSNLTTGGYVFAKNGVVMNKYAKVGTPCDWSKETFALQAWDTSGPYNKGLRMIVCSNNGSGVWEYPQKDLQSELDKTNTSNAGLQAQIDTLRKNGIAIEYDYQKYEDRDGHDTGWDCSSWSKPVVSDLWGNDSGLVINVWASDNEGVPGACHWWVQLRNSQCCNTYGVVAFKSKYGGPQGYRGPAGDWGTSPYK
ncbi:MAG: hypothetical protein RLZZ24_1508, partial [Pseudomonadota bacterium]